MQNGQFNRQKCPQAGPTKSRSKNISDPTAIFPTVNPQWFTQYTSVQSYANGQNANFLRPESSFYLPPVLTLKKSRKSRIDLASLLPLQPTKIDQFKAEGLVVVEIQQSNRVPAHQISKKAPLPCEHHIYEVGRYYLNILCVCNLI